MNTYLVLFTAITLATKWNGYTNCPKNNWNKQKKFKTRDSHDYKIIENI